MALEIRISLLLIGTLFLCSCSKEKTIVREWKSRLLIPNQEAFYDTLGVSESPFFNNLHKLENWVSSNISDTSSSWNEGEFRVDSIQSYNVDLDSSIVRVFKIILHGEGFDKCNLAYVQGIGLVYIDYNIQPYYLTNERVILNGEVKSTDYTKLLEKIILPDSIEIFNSLDTTKIIEVK